MAIATIAPDDWKPNEKTLLWCYERGYTREQIREGIGEMIDWSQGNANRAVAKKSDWDATFRNWMRRKSPPKQDVVVMNEDRLKEQSRFNREFDQQYLAYVNGR
jgi:hypothetical protein